VLVALAAVALVSTIRRRILSPLRRLGQATDVVAAGEMTHRVPVEGNDEIGDLARRFNEMTERLAESERLRMEFLSMVSHEMRTPLTLIKISASRVLGGRSEGAPDSSRRSLDIILEETDRLQYLVEDLLEVARAQIGAFRIEPSPTDTAEFLSGLLHPFEEEAEKKRIRFSYDFSSLPPAVIDGKRVGQALRNLVTNALKFTPSGGEVTVKGSLKSNRIELAVTDSGPGIPTQDLPHLFKRFYKVTRQQGSTTSFGLGLAIVREIAQAHGGEVEVQSQIGRGAQFRFYIPFRSVPSSENALKT
jgi:signal transduction histidine kinase